MIEWEDLIVVGNHSLLLMSKVRIDMEIGLELMEGIGNNYLVGNYLVGNYSIGNYSIGNYLTVVGDLFCKLCTLGNLR